MIQNNISKNNTKQYLNMFDPMPFLLFLATLGSGICVGPGVDLDVGSGAVGVGVGSGWVGVGVGSSV